MTLSLVIHLVVAVLIASLAFSQWKQFRRRRVAPALGIVPAVLGLGAVVGEFVVATGQPIGALGVAVWLVFLLVGTRLVDDFGLAASSWRVLRAHRELQGLQERVNRLHSEGEAIDHEVSFAAMADGDERGPEGPESLHSGRGATSERIWDQAQRARSEMTEILARLATMRDTTTAPLIDLLVESYGHAARLDAPTPARADYLSTEIPKRASELYRDFTDPG